MIEILKRLYVAMFVAAIVASMPCDILPDAKRRGDGTPREAG